VSIPGISPINVCKGTGNLGENNATAPNGLDASVNKHAYTGSNPGIQDTVAQILNPDFTVSLSTVTSTVSTTQVADNFKILQNNSFVAQPVVNPTTASTFEAFSPDQINLQAVVSLGVLQTNENLAQAMFGLSKPEPEALLSMPYEVQAVQPANATELNPGRSQYFFTAYFKMMNMPISGSAVDMTA